MASSAPEPELFPFARGLPSLAELPRRYREADPFPHVVLPDFLDEGVARRMLAAFPGPHDTRWTQYRHYNEDMLGTGRREGLPPGLARVVDALSAPPFVAWVGELIGAPGLLADPDLVGGGLHQAERGGFLNLHTDFTTHHHEHRWRRRCNLIVYLNEGWDDAWGGQLELWDPVRWRCGARVSPRFNQCVIFRTDERSFHGYPDRITCPPGATRKSLALYYYTADHDPRERARPTTFRARPGDGLRAPLIWADSQALALYSRVKRALHLSDDLVSRVLGLLSRRR